MGEEEQMQPALENEATAETTDGGDVFSWPVLRFDIPPKRVCHLYQQFRKASNPNNFLKGVKWSPDGSCFLTSSEDNTLRVFNLPDNVDGSHVDACISKADEERGVLTVPKKSYGQDNISKQLSRVNWQSKLTNNFKIHTLQMLLLVKESLCMTIVGIPTCLFQIQLPVYLQVAPVTILFISGMPLLASCVAHTGLMMPWMRSLLPFQLLSTPLELSIISAIAFCPAHTGMFATGSYSQTTAIYSEDNMELLYILHGQEGGVTHVQFSKDGNYLYTGGRKDPYIYCWDIRNTLDVVYKLYRSSEQTNQRILFDIEPCGHHLGTGGQDGQVHIYDLQTGQWVASFQAAYDTVNGFSFHPFLPIAASSSGHRRFGMPDSCDNDLNLIGDENCVSIWSFATMTENAANGNWGDTNTQSEHEDLRQHS
ncbi:PREDICTED: telomerase Cajal body protein 1 isoform X3 [Nelumbo nucifera]|uniref:Telomerase Cajal body protein 1 isoform X3 n=1 Tax=Nelumbo nucifera TaxID=4432 RepID=A0A1U8QB60_NELNU|nr:PREDICTED: telomerase Cajal body protein 1 isoform X3 [Nelumbo nucifera]